MDRRVDPFDPNYSVTHLMGKQTSHRIADLKPNEKFLELKFIILEKREDTVTKRGKHSITQFMVADETGCIFVNFYSNSGTQTPILMT